MSLLDALKESKPEKRKIDSILAKVTEDERTALLDALSDTAGWSHERLADTLSTLVSPVSESSVRRYRRDILGLKG